MLGWIQTILIGLMKSVFGIDGSGGVPTAPTAALATNTTQIATTAFVLANPGTPSVVTVAGEAADATCFLVFVTAATGDLGVKTNASLAFDSTTGIVSFLSGIRATSAASGTIAQIIKGAASRSVALLNLQTSAGASLGNVGGCIFDDFADASTTHTDGTFDVLSTHTTVANTLAVNGDKIEFDATLVVVGHAISTDQVQVTFGGITIFDSTARNYAVGATINIRGRIIRATATTCRATVEFFPAGSATILGFEQITYTAEATLTGMTLTGTNILAIQVAATGTNSASGDVKLTMCSVDLIPAA